jgi:hypothetical protein
MNVNRWRVERYQGPTGIDDGRALAQKIQPGRKAATTRDEAVTTDAVPKTCQENVEATFHESHMASTAEAEGAGEENRADGCAVDLPRSRNAWPSEWQKAWEEHVAILEVEAESQSRVEAERHAEEVVRKEYRRTYGPRVALAERLAMELGVNLQALSTKLNTDLRLLDESHASELHLRLLRPNDEVCEALSMTERDDLVTFVSRYTLELPM